MLFFTKKDSSLPFYVDYRALKKLAMNSSYPRPRIDDILSQLATANVLTEIHLYSGYHKTRFCPDSIPPTAFNMSYGHFKFQGPPSGLFNVAATFMDIMSLVIIPDLDTSVIIYLDVILVYSDKYHDHIEHVKTVLNVLRNNKLYDERSKCSFGV